MYYALHTTVQHNKSYVLFPLKLSSSDEKLKSKKKVKFPFYNLYIEPVYI